MDEVNFRRNLLKVKRALDLAVTYHTKDNEKNAALHASDQVLYSPLTVILQGAQRITADLIHGAVPDEKE